MQTKPARADPQARLTAMRFLVGCYRFVPIPKELHGLIKGKDLWPRSGPLDKFGAPGLLAWIVHFPSIRFGITADSADMLKLLTGRSHHNLRWQQILQALGCEVHLWLPLACQVLEDGCPDRHKRSQPLGGDGRMPATATHTHTRTAQELRRAKTFWPHRATRTQALRNCLLGPPWLCRLGWTEARPASLLHCLTLSITHTYCQ